MPTYVFVNTETQTLEEHVMSIKAYDDFKNANPHLERYFDEPSAFTFGGMGVIKTDNTFKEVLSKISDAHPKSALASDHRRKSVKEVKTEQIVKKHLKLQAEKKTAK